MVNTSKIKKKRNILIIFVSIFLSLILFNLFFNIKDSQIEKLKINKEVEFKAEIINNKRIICSGKSDFDQCVNINKKNNVLLLGNSQLNGIINKKNDDFLTSYYLFNKLKNRNQNLITFALANGSLSEFLILTEYITNKIKLEKIIISLVYDDLREGSIRKDISDFFDQQNFKDQFASTKHKKKILEKTTNKKNVIKKFENKDTPQKIVEKKFNEFFNYCCNLNEKKLLGSNRIYHNLYLLRNYVFNINPSTERKLIPAFYEDNINSLREIIKFSKKNNIALYLYIAPIRNDIKIPYNKDQYKNFIKFIKKLSESNNLPFKNFEKEIPNHMWGTKPGTSLNRDVEVDFMHFQGTGHKIFSSSIFKFITK